MSFARAGIRRFNEIESCVPAPGTYDVSESIIFRKGANDKTLVLSKAKSLSAPNVRQIAIGITASTVAAKESIFSSKSQSMKTVGTQTDIENAKLLLTTSTRKGVSTENHSEARFKIRHLDDSRQQEIKCIKEKGIVSKYKLFNRSQNRDEIKACEVEEIKRLEKNIKDLQEELSVSNTRNRDLQKEYDDLMSCFTFLREENRLNFSDKKELEHAFFESKQEKKKMKGYIAAQNEKLLALAIVTQHREETRKKEKRLLIEEISKLRRDQNLGLCVRSVHKKMLSDELEKSKNLKKYNESVNRKFFGALVTIGYLQRGIESLKSRKDLNNNAENQGIHGTCRRRESKCCRLCKNEVDVNEQETTQRSVQQCVFLLAWASNFVVFAMLLKWAILVSEQMSRERKILRKTLVSERENTKRLLRVRDELNEQVRIYRRDRHIIGKRYEQLQTELCDICRYHTGHQ